MIGVVADDITGAGDIAAMFAKSSLTADIYSFEPEEDFRPQAGADVLVLDTDSRFDERETAYGKVYKASKELRRLGCSMLFNKTCSVFRGNIGAEFDAMLDALGAEFAVVVLGFPKNGRTTVDGIHYVHGVKLEHSQFRNDPVHPMTDSDLVRILAGQTSRSVSLIDYRAIARGPAFVRELLDSRREAGGYVILDAPDQAALAVIAEAIREEKIVCGASAIAEELALLIGPEERSDRSLSIDVPFRPELGIPVFAGSLTPQTAAQVEAFRASGAPAYRLDAERLLEPALRREEIDRLCLELAVSVGEGKDVLLHTENRPERVAQAKGRAAAAGYSNTEVSRLVSGAVAEIADRVLSATGQNRFLAAGGDTSAAVCSRLHIKGMRVRREIEPGLPSCVSLASPRPLLFALKSGSFGEADFFDKAIGHLKSCLHQV